MPVTTAKNLSSDPISLAKGAAAELLKAKVKSKVGSQPSSKKLVSTAVKVKSKAKPALPDSLNSIKKRSAATKSARTPKSRTLESICDILRNASKVVRRKPPYSSPKLVEIGTVVTGKDALGEAFLPFQSTHRPVDSSAADFVAFMDFLSTVTE